MPKVPYCGRSMFYQEAGEGPVLIFLHGNTASSRLFEPLLPLYTPHFRCVLLDFLGNGRSDRVESFPADLWQEEARQALALIRAAGYERPCLLGTSGGAWAAMNAALLAPGAVGAVVADSFDGRSLHPGFARDLTAERDRAKRDKAAREFYAWCQGPDWEAVVDRDTDALLRCAASGRPLFCGPLEQMRPPVLLMGSREDPMCRPCACLHPVGTLQFFPGRRRLRRRSWHFGSGARRPRGCEISGRYNWNEGPCECINKIV